MPIYRYIAKDKGCSFCLEGFDIMQKLHDSKLTKCPECNAPVKREFSYFSVTGSKSGFDRKAKEKGFHKLKKVDKGKYEKLY